MNDRVAVKTTRATRNGSVARRAQPAVQPRPDFPGQVVLVLQGGGALGAYQVGVYEAMHEHGAEPDWVIGTSIGAINAALIAGNAPANRFERLKEFWARVEADAAAPGFSNTSRVSRTRRSTCPPSRAGSLRSSSRTVPRGSARTFRSVWKRPRITRRSPCAPR